MPDIVLDCVVKFNYQFRKFARPSTGQLIGFMANGEPEGFRQGLALFRCVLLFSPEYKKIFILLNISKTNLHASKTKEFYITQLITFIFEFWRNVIFAILFSLFNCYLIVYRFLLLGNIMYFRITYNVQYKILFDGYFLCTYGLMLRGLWLGTLF